MRLACLRNRHVCISGRYFYCSYVIASYNERARRPPRTIKFHGILVFTRGHTVRSTIFTDPVTCTAWCRKFLIILTVIRFNSNNIINDVRVRLHYILYRIFHRYSINAIQPNTNNLIYFPCTIL